MPKQSYYFSHDNNAHDDQKLLKLMQDMGMDGYGIFWFIAELLHQAGGKLPLDYPSIAFAMRTDCERITRVINDYNLFCVQDGQFWSETLLQRIELQQSKSKKASQAAMKKWAKQRKIEESDANALQTHSESTANAMPKKGNKGKEINKRKVFRKPSLQEVSTYCQERKNSIAPQKFLDHYESNGWKVGKNPMKDWKAAVRNWESRAKEFHPKQAAVTVPKSRILNDYSAN